MKTQTLPLLVIALVGSTMVAPAAPERERAEAPLAIKQLAPQGRSEFPPASEFDLATYRGRVVLLNFWATWCLPCRVEVPELVKLEEHFEKDELAVVGISVDSRGTPEQVQGQVKRFVKRYKMVYQVFIDRDLELVKQYGNFATVPTTFLIDQNGRVAQTYDVPQPYDQLAEDIRGLLDKPTPPDVTE